MWISTGTTTARKRTTNVGVTVEVRLPQPLKPFEVTPGLNSGRQLQFKGFFRSRLDWNDRANPAEANIPVDRAEHKSNGIVV